MENSDAENDTSAQPVRRKGGLKTMPFVIANEAFEKIAIYGIQPNMILYLTTMYHLSVATGASLLFIWGAMSYVTPILGFILSDSYFGRFRVISGGTIISLMGSVVLWLTSIIQEARPPQCELHSDSCVKANGGQIALLFTAFVLMSIGAGGIRPCSLAFGADQFEDPKNPSNERTMESFFNWYYASVGISIIIAVTLIVYIQNDFGWIVGFGVPVGLMLVSAIMFLFGSKLYIKVNPDKSLLIGLVQVLVATWRNMHLTLAPDDQQYHQAKGSKFTRPTNELRYLNKACIITNPEKDLKPNGSASSPWRLCSVVQVEVLKALIKLLPIWSSGIIGAVTINQGAFPVLQANTMDRRLVGNFKIPAGSYSLFIVLTLTVWLALYDRVIVPIISKFTKRQRGIGVKIRMGMGLVAACLATGSAALVERNRRATALHEGLAETPKAIVSMSAMWIILQYCFTGLVEALNSLGQIELYYSEFPKSMSSIAMVLVGLGVAIGNFVGALIVNIVDSVSKRGGTESWVSSNLNKGHYDYYYWVLTVLNIANLFYYVFISRAYNAGQKVWSEGIVGDDQENQTGSLVTSGEPI